MAEPDAPRRVVTGQDEDGRSRIDSDALMTTSAVRPDGSVVTDLWKVAALPTASSAADLVAGEVVGPPPGGLVVKTLLVAPNTGMDAREYDAALARAYGMGEAPLAASGVPGMHRTRTVDVVTVISGEVVLVLETEETTLRPGDSVVQRGTSHAWHNRTTEPCFVVAVMMAADVDSKPA
jgi:quercetin dioxygenase-like cupin family protein